MKSDSHILLQRRALTWLATLATQRGIRGCEEVILRKGYVCDAAAICGLQWAWQKRFEVGKRYAQVPGRQLSEYQASKSAQQTDDFSFLFEAKVSKSDYLSTFHPSKITTRKERIANFQYIVAAKGIWMDWEIPEGWGLLVESGVGLKLVRDAPYVPLPIEKLHEFAYILLRSGHNRKFSYTTEVLYNNNLV